MLPFITNAWFGQLSRYCRLKGGMPCRRTQRYHPCLEPLEDRQVPSTLLEGMMVNTTLAFTQQTTSWLGTQSSVQAVAADVDHGSVIVWCGNGTGDASGVFAQRFDPGGAPLGQETLVNTTIDGDQNYPLVARAAATGRYVIVWYSNSSLYARVYDPGGTPLTGEVVIAAGNTKTSNFTTSVAMDADGDFVVTYLQAVQKSFFSDETLFVQRVNASGVLQGRPIKVGQPRLINGLRSVAMDAAGNFVVAWDEDLSTIYAQRYSARGNALGQRIVVNPAVPNGGSQSNCNIVMDSAGNFLVTWGVYYNPPLDGLSVERVGQLFYANGSKRGNLLRFGITDIASRGVTMQGNGEFALTWSSPQGITAQRFNPDGTPNGSPFFVQSPVSGATLIRSSAAVDNSGKLVVVWNQLTSSNPDNPADVYGKLIEPPSTLAGKEVVPVTLMPVASGALPLAWPAPAMSEAAPLIQAALAAAPAEPALGSPAFLRSGPGLSRELVSASMTEWPKRSLVPAASEAIVAFRRPAVRVSPESEREESVLDLAEQDAFFGPHPEVEMFGLL